MTTLDDLVRICELNPMPGSALIEGEYSVMKDNTDKQTIDLFSAKRRGRPVTGKALSSAERQRKYRQTKKQTRQVEPPLSLHQDVTKNVFDQAKYDFARRCFSEQFHQFCHYDWLKDKDLNRVILAIDRERSAVWKQHSGLMIYFTNVLTTEQQKHLTTAFHAEIDQIQKSANEFWTGYFCAVSGDVD